MISLTNAILFTCLLCCGVAEDVDSPLYVKEKKLIDKLFDDTVYSKAVSPQVYPDAAVKINVTFNLVSILDINEKEGYLMATFYPALLWEDPRLKWTKDNSTPFDKITVLASNIWKPDMEVYNSMMSSEQSVLVDAQAVVTSTGTVVFVPHMVIKTPCQYNLESFPYDTHSCTIHYGSWASSASKIDIAVASTPKLDTYMEHQDWNLDNLTVQSFKLFYEADSDHYSQVDITLHLSRRGSYYYRLFVAPAAVCMFVIPIIHFTPPSSNEKLTLSGLILVATIVMFEMLEDFFPPFSVNNVPVLLSYYTMLLLVLFISMLLSCLSVMVGTGDTKSKRVPRVLRKFCIDGLGYICCAKGRTARYDYELLHLERALRFSAAPGVVSEVREDAEVFGDEGSAALERQNSDSDGGQAENKGLQEVLKSLVNELQYARYKEQVKSEWAQLAIVLDRTGGLVLLMIVLIMTAIVTLRLH